jgi:hypothetical protein
MGQGSAGVGKEIGDESPGIDTAASAGLQDAHGGGVGRRALLGGRAVGDPPGDDGVAQGAFGFVVGGGQIGMGDDGGDGGPVVQHLASARTFSASSSRWRLQARFRRARRGLTMRAPVPSATSWIRPSRSSHAPKWAPCGVTARATPLRIRWARQR